MPNQYLEPMVYESDTDPVGLPNGVPFLTEQEASRLDDRESALIALFRKNRFSRVVPPAFEYYETFEKGGGADIARRSFTFKDREGKLLSLRYDMTTPIARWSAMRFGHSDLPLKFWYAGDVYREQPSHKGKYRQIRQAGVELIGDASREADREIIEILAESLSILDTSHTLVVGDVRLYRTILSRLEADETRQEAIHALFNRKDKTSLTELLKTTPGNDTDKTALLFLLDFCGTMDQTKAQTSGLDPEFRTYAERTLETVQSVSSGVRSRMVVDFGLIKDFSYYTSLTLEGYLSGTGFPVASGGRYDGLFQSFGKDFPAVGFAVDLSYCLS